ncbi:early nodulin-75 isoform X1 [Drosophila ficusphila]|uniref:early nodulin-75 isoform X1 n=1 Tax=Drosophila ficusphila TaxID=30025 RepID=UPI0007E60FCF|nr:early nodulin-75 isoform X1 [Drosophila ficusphila]
MCNLFWLSACFLAIWMPFALGDSNATSVEREPKTEPKIEVVPAAEKLIRYRRQPPFAVIKRSKLRRRTKGPPKIKYGPPPPHIRYAKPSFPSHLEEPSFSLDDFQHLKFDGADFKIPTSSYEAQSMDLDFYNHDSEPDHYGAHKFPSLDFGLVTTHEHVPHEKYGVPPVHQGFQPDHSFATHYEPPPASPVHIPSTRYGVPSAPAHVPNFSHQDLPAPDSFSIYEQKIPNAGYHQNFAEPPKKPPKHASHHNPNYEIAYSPPAFEISTSYQSNHQQSYVPPHPSQPHEGFAEPPSNNYVKPAHHPPPNSYAPPPHPSSSYGQPAQHPPSNYNQPAHHPSPSYNQPPQHPSSSYDHAPQHPSSTYDQPPQHPSSTYDQPPQHPSSTYDQPPQHPSSSYDQPPQDHPNSYQHPPSSTYDQAPQHPPTNYVSSDSHSYPQDDYAPPSEELPLNPHHKFPSFDFPKSSYEVPIYDPVPFEASNRDEQESYPPILASSPDQNEIPSDAQPSGSSKRRKRKRKPSNGIVPGKHTLDVPELQQAYDADSHLRKPNESADTDANSSHFVERKQTINFVTPPPTTSTTPAPWSPMKGRSSPTRAPFIPTVITSTPVTPTTARSRSRGSSRYRSKSQQPVNPSSPDPTTTSVRIEQSHSQSYYDGTIAPPTRQPFSPTIGGRGARPTRPSYVRNHGPVSPLALQPGDPGRGAPTSKRTTKGVFDTTLFKTPQSDREIERNLHGLRQNLPKNHKLY